MYACCDKNKFHLKKKVLSQLDLTRYPRDYENIIEITL